MGKKYKDIEIGDTYGRLTVIEKGKYEKFVQFWECKCSCGNVETVQVNMYDLRNGHTQSCGCIGKERLKYYNDNRLNKTFHDWCNENNRLDLIERWDYELNDKAPDKVAFSSNKKYYFKCNKNKSHSSTSMSLTHIVRKNSEVICKECNSFAQWCTENNELDVLKRWDYDLNKLKPEDVSYGMNKKYYFKCPCGKHESELKILNNFTNKNSREPGVMRCNKCNSFAQYLLDLYGSDALEKYWNYNKNEINPWDISYASNNLVWINCQEKEYHEPYKIACNNFVAGKRCPYCSGKKINKLDSIGYLHPEILEIWSDKNKKSPYEVGMFSGKQVWWKCKDGKHKDYIRTTYNSLLCEFRCPECSRERNESFLQEKVRIYLNKKLRYELLHERNCSIVPINPKTHMSLPFDNEIITLRLIIEVHGHQHYEIDGFHYMNARHYNITPEDSLKQRKLYDRYKKAVAECNGYFYLEIPYWTEKDNSYKTLINEKINQIKKIINKAS
jgi:hypothetical protein